MIEERANLKGKVAFVIGGGVGIGRAVILALARAGVDIAACDRNESALMETKVLVETLGQRCVALKADVMERSELAQFYGEGSAAFERLDILVNVAGRVLRRSFLDGNEMLDMQDIRRNYVYVIQSIRAAVPLIQRGGRGGSIINFTSIEAQRGAASFSVYAGAKAATNSLTRALAVELGGLRIRVNVIAPDTTPSIGNTYAMGPDLEKRAADLGEAGLGEAMRVYLPLGVSPAPEDLADAVLFLASDPSKFVTGAILPVDAGTAAALEFFNWPYGDGFVPAPIGYAGKLMFSETLDKD